MKVRIVLPLIVALALIIGTVGIVSAEFLLTRSVHLPVTDPISVDLLQGTTLPTLCRGYSLEVPINVTNSTPNDCLVTIEWDTPPTGISITSDHPSIAIPKGSGGRFTLTITASETASEGDLVFRFPFSVL